MNIYPERMMMPAPPRWFKAGDILSGQVRLHSYPLTFVCVDNPGTAGAHNLETTMAAAELLEAQGWRVVNFADDGRRVYLRRGYHPGSPGTPPPVQHPGR
ncbi:hypothetical protein C6361_11610 [Plantactinospora sp. BC1]|uniref:hypothetical protein n=1 Tax=Plantactinospora sp. BC1 TaxID=2108470 RepID=UPI000D152AEF|nr:hypothetical protein [Plantactinospora sp. BC1]AVT30035.1 hypothetical protein C6361_11610 [Plantactinospora sp. BC1]